MNAYYSRTREDIARLIPSPAGKIVLDVGCGEGMFGELLLSHFNAKEAWGVEPEEKVSSSAKTRLQRVLVGTLDARLSDLPDNHFDMIFFNDSLEHMEDPWSALLSVRRKLAPGGVVCASIPNVRWYRNIINLLIFRDWKYTDEGILDRTHLRFFTVKSIKRLFESTDYRIHQLRGVKYSGGKLWIIPKLFSIFTLLFFDDCFYKNYFVVAEVNNAEHCN